MKIFYKDLEKMIVGYLAEKQENNPMEQRKELREKSTLYDEEVP